MIEIKIPKDIREYDAKLIGPFSLRQTICIAIAAVLAIVSYSTIGRLLPQDFKILLCLVISLPALLCGWYKPYGLPFEKYAQIVLITSILAPKHRKYQTENAFEQMTADEKKEKQLKRKDIIKKNKQYRKTNNKNKNAEFIDYQ